MNCPNCNTEIDPQNINIQTDIAQCQSCHHIFKISENIETMNHDGFDMDDPPKGTWIKREMNKMVIGVSTRSPFAFFLIPFMVVWSSMSIGGIYGSQIMSGEFNPFMSLFGIPFLLGSIIFWSIALMTITGKVELTLDKQGGKIFTGVGVIGITKRFQWSEVSSIEEKVSNLRMRGRQNTSLVFEGKRRISFGYGLIREHRQYYLYRALKQIISHVKNHRDFLRR
ncbi:MAG: hypothetical protein GY827_11725 [Cytophagales bacterium]|nr:hypothetical protein [Cytophagales bacterium]